jgi:putative restriction endonuclease
MSTFLMLWNPKSGNLSNEDWEEEGRIINDEGLDALWSVGNRKSGVAVGDTVFLVRTISERGIVRSGVVTGDLVHEEHWDLDRAAEGATVNYAPVRWTKQLPIGERLAVETLLTEVPEVPWNNLYASGIRVPDGATKELNELWKAHCLGASKESGPGGPPAGDDVAVGTTFLNRKLLSASGLHRPVIQGIAGNQATGATSVVVSGGYEDDEDFGDVIIYTGAGGNDPVTKTQIADQEFTRGNLALAKSCEFGLPVRVIRGAHDGSAHAPPSGYRYDGYFQVDQYWHERGKSGFRIYRFLLRRIQGDAGPPEISGDPSSDHPVLPDGQDQPKQGTFVVRRVIRDSAVSQAVKTLYGYQCQICRTKVGLPTGFYAEGAHIRPLGKPHAGKDVPQNLLCLCPTCHVRFDRGAVTIEESLKVRDCLSGELVADLLISDTHTLDAESLAYHREVIARIN